MTLLCLPLFPPLPPQDVESWHRDLGGELWGISEGSRTNSARAHGGDAVTSCSNMFARGPRALPARFQSFTTWSCSPRYVTLFKMRLSFSRFISAQFLGKCVGGAPVDPKPGASSIVSSH